MDIFSMHSTRTLSTLLLAFLLLQSSAIQAGQQQEVYYGNRHAAGHYAYEGDVPSKVEIALYRQSSPSPCNGPHAQQAVEVGLSHHWKWVVLYRTQGSGEQATLRAFDNSWQALRYLIEDLNCQDPLVQYRYGYALHMQREYERSAIEFEKAAGGIREYYPQMLPIVLSNYAEALGVTGQLDQSVALNRQVVGLLPNSVSAVLNLAGRLSHRLAPGDQEEIRALLKKAEAMGVSNYGEQVIQKIEARLDS